MKLLHLLESSELMTEFFWYQKYIDKHDLTIQIEIEDNCLHVYHEGEKLVKWSALHANIFRTSCLSNAVNAYFSTPKQLYPLSEPIIATDAHLSVQYAKSILVNRFELGEPTIAKDQGASRIYKEFLKYDV